MATEKKNIYMPLKNVYPLNMCAPDKVVVPPKLWGSPPPKKKVGRMTWGFAGMFFRVFGAFDVRSVNYFGQTGFELRMTWGFA